MPKRATPYKSYKKKTYVKKKYVPKKMVRYNPTRNIVSVKTGLGFPKKMIMTHRYCANQSVQSSTGVMANYVFSCNGMYDPDITGTGGQPLYFDQMTAIYNHYTVIGSKVTIKVLNASPSTGIIGCGILINDDTATTPTTLEGMNEQGQASKPKYITYGSSAPVVLTSKWSAKKTFGGSILGNDQLQGNVSNNPTEQSYYNFYVQCLDGASTVQVYAEVCIEYIAVWDELKDIARS